MEWCKCPNCRHKMFMYDPAKVVFATINIKCSSCKSIVDVVLSHTEVKVDLVKKES